MMNEQIHTPVLLVETLECLKPQAGETYADMTAGYGGHAAEVLAITGNYAGSLLVDRDERAITALQDRFKDSGIQLRRTDFASASQDAGDSTYDMILADLGVSSLHLDQADRGFSFAQDGPLDMRMDQSKLLTAAELVNKSREEQLADILYRYGEEPKSRQIARLIVQHRPFKTTAELAAVVKKAWPGHSRVHPATRTFQALRIAVNDELGLLERALPDWIRMLKPGGRLAVISFHSLEDRIVKQFFQEHGGDRFDAELRLLTKRPIVAGPQESVSNPRARSAKLRAAVKTKN